MQPTILLFYLKSAEQSLLIQCMDQCIAEMCTDYIISLCWYINGRDRIHFLKEVENKNCNTNYEIHGFVGVEFPMITYRMVTIRPTEAILTKSSYCLPMGSHTLSSPLSSMRYSLLKKDK